ncbi:MAG: hypothetical protein OXI23_05465, partial [Gemmatimonadota bacterium]|nr:hypothetical protein [Gemmatimonadota bacterium]
MTRFKLYIYLIVCLFALAMMLFFLGCTDQLITENDPALQEVSVGKHDVSRKTMTDDPITTPHFKDASIFVVSEKKNWQEKTYEFSYATQQ